MSKLIYFKRYLYIIDRLRSHNCDFKDLQKHIIRKLENEDIDTNFEYSVRTFERDKKDILDIFGIVINYNRKDKTYSIDEEEIEDQSVTRIMDAFSIHHALQEGNKLSPSVFLEKRKSSGTENIHGIIIVFNFENKFYHFYRKTIKILWNSKYINFNSFIFFLM